jgi:hypothetical protein
MDRRVFIVAGVGACAAPLVGCAQHGNKIRRIGFLGGVPPTIFETFRQALHDLGWNEGQNLAIERHAAERGEEQLPLSPRNWSGSRLR